MQLVALLKEMFGRDGLDTTNFALGADNTCSLKLKDGTVVSIEQSPDESTALLSATLCRYPDDGRRGQLFDVLMEAHAYGLATDDAYFAASRATGSVFLTKRIALAAADVDGFTKAVASFIAVHAYWRGRFDQGELTVAATGEAQQGSDVPGLFV